MAFLHYRKWIRPFSVSKFSSEPSMRDYLFNAPELFFKDDDRDSIIPIKEEMGLSKSNIVGKERGRSDIILCRIRDFRERATQLDSGIEIWVIELKNGEASYENGFEQLFDYLSSINNSQQIQDHIRETVLQKIREKQLDASQLEEAPLNLYGSLVAPSFDLIGENTEFKPYIGKEWGEFEQNLKRGGKLDKGFTLYDAVNTTYSIFPICLKKLVRFTRKDEEIIYTEDALGQKAAKRSYIPPSDMFKSGIISKEDKFYFRDSNNKEYKDVECHVLKKGRGDAFKIRILSIGEKFPEIKFPTGWQNDQIKSWENRSLPADDTAVNCSITLHKFFSNEMKDKEILTKLKSKKLGEFNFVREDGKTLNQLRNEYRNEIVRR